MLHTLKVYHHLWSASRSANILHVISSLLGVQAVVLWYHKLSTHANTRWWTRAWWPPHSMVWVIIWPSPNLENGPETTYRMRIVRWSQCLALWNPLMGCPGEILLSTMAVLIATRLMQPEDRRKLNKVRISMSMGLEGHFSPRVTWDLFRWTPDETQNLAETQQRNHRSLEKNTVRYHVDTQGIPRYSRLGYYVMQSSQQLVVCLSGLQNICWFTAPFVVVVAWGRLPLHYFHIRYCIRRQKLSCLGYKILA